MQEQLLFDLIESEADVNVFLDRDDFKAEIAGIIITSSAVGHMPKARGDKYTLWFGRGVLRETFKDRKSACLRAIEIMGKVNVPMTPRIEGKDSKYFNKLLSQEETKKRTPP